MNDALEHYSRDRSREGEARAGAHTGAAGGAACGDLINLSFELEGGRVARPQWLAEGCATARAAAAASAELLDEATLAEAALLSASAIEAELGGLSPIGRHGAELAADAVHRALGEAALSGERMLDPPEPGRPRRVLVAMSGGVDSAVALHREREAGAEVFAVTLELWSDPANDGEQSCCSPQAVRLARSVAHRMGAPHLTVDLRDRFRAGVVEPFLEGYAAGVTPNPCVRCNGRVRLEPMLGIAERLGAAGLATGHYARTVDDGDGPLLAPAADDAKDQCYMLAALPTALLGRFRFPLAELTKPEVRAIAERAEIPVASRPESQDLCFLAGEGKAGFLARHGDLGERQGEIVDSGGAVLGTHSGHHNFTVGQRRGIGIGSPEPLYVLATDAERNRVVVGVAAELERDRVTVGELVLHRPAERVDKVRLRYRSPMLDCRLDSGAGVDTVVRLERPVRRPAPGQTAVFFAGDAIVGHAVVA
ncbi:MAG TPA: tRNA 2-thiouridine(34) synthase MnmA [Solirubrobacterales bacterium]|nr:tRNA 2-thiouridine(34) synthase MnmA [Solirubrobacterales bacterium]